MVTVCSSLFKPPSFLDVERFCRLSASLTCLAESLTSRSPAALWALAGLWMDENSSRESLQPAEAGECCGRVPEVPRCHNHAEGNAGGGGRGVDHSCVVQDAFTRERNAPIFPSASWGLRVPWWSLSCVLPLSPRRPGRLPRPSNPSSPAVPRAPCTSDGQGPSCGQGRWREAQGPLDDRKSFLQRWHCAICAPVSSCCPGHEVSFVPNPYLLKRLALHSVQCGRP